MSHNLWLFPDLEMWKTWFITSGLSKLRTFKKQCEHLEFWILQKLWPWTNKDFWRFALSRDHKCLPKLHLIKSRLFQVQVKVSHSRALELHFKWTCTIYLEMTWRVKLNLDTWSWFLLAIPSVDPWTVKHGIRLNNHCAKHFLDKGAVQFLFRISHVDQLLPKIAKNTNC